jgi:hypothetical protein
VAFDHQAGFLLSRQLVGTDINASIMSNLHDVDLREIHVWHGVETWGWKSWLGVAACPPAEKVVIRKGRSGACEVQHDIVEECMSEEEMYAQHSSGKPQESLLCFADLLPQWTSLSKLSVN